MVEGARCAEHQLEATAACTRCGTFVCVRCNWQSFCAACFKLQAPGARDARLVQLAKYSWGSFLLAAVALNIPLAGCIALPLIVTGFGAGVVSLILGRRVAGLAPSAWAGIVLNGLAIGLMVNGFITGFLRARGRQ